MNQDSNEDVDTKDVFDSKRISNQHNQEQTESTQDSKYFVAARILIGGSIAAVVLYTLVQMTITQTTQPDILSNNDENKFDSQLNIAASNEKDTEPAEKMFMHSVKSDSATYRNYYAALIVQEGVTWKDHPVAVGDLNLFSVSQNDYLPAEGLEYSVVATLNPFKDKKFQYYHIGVVNKMPLYVALVPDCEASCINSMLYFVQNSSSTFTFLEEQSTIYLGEKYHGFVLADTVEIDKKFTLDAHQMPESIIINGISFSSVPEYGPFNSTGPAFFADSFYNVAQQQSGWVIDFFANTEYGPAFFALNDSPKGGTQSLNYAIRLAGGLIMQLNYTLDFVQDDGVPQIEWLDGTSNQNKYRTDGLSLCIDQSSDVMKVNIPTDQLSLAGYTINQEPVYSIADPNHPVITRLFTKGNVYSYFGYDYLTDKAEEVFISKSDFMKENGVVIFVDTLGFQHVLTQIKYASLSWCML